MRPRVRVPPAVLAARHRVQIQNDVDPVRGAERDGAVEVGEGGGEERVRGEGRDEVSVVERDAEGVEVERGEVGCVGLGEEVVEVLRAGARV